MRALCLLTTSLVALSLFATQPVLANSAPSAHQDRMATSLTSPGFASRTAAPATPRLKRTIAVGKIDAFAGVAEPYAASSAGPAVAAMLATALDQSGDFIVAERDGLSQILTEQELVTNHVAQGSAGPTPGSVIPAQYLVVGVLTELSTGDRGSNIGLNFGLPSGLIGGLSLNGQTGRVALDLRLVNTRTGEVEDSFKVRKELSLKSVGLNAGYRGIEFGGNQFWNTPLGGAMRAALNDAVARLAADVARDGWDALVAQVDGNTIYINAGSEAGLKTGDRLFVERVTGALTDPATNRVLTVQKARVADVQLSSVDAKFSIGTLVQSGAMSPERGDTVVFSQ